MRIMEEVVNEIIEYIKRKTKDFSYLDQSQIYEEVAGKEIGRAHV